jgi:TonB family protein
MKKLIFICIFLFVAGGLFAQQDQSYIIHKDTINLRGFIYEANGKPSIGRIVHSKQRDLKYNYFQIWTQTDSSGFFIMKGAKSVDTLTIDVFKTSMTFYNNGSRFIIIYLPSPTTNPLNSQNPIRIQSPRLRRKNLPAFKVIPMDFQPDYFNVEKMPEFKGGAGKFFDYIQNGLIYPKNAIMNNIEGTVEIEFSILRDGNLADFTILKGIGYGCDDAVIGIIKKSPLWRPGIYQGRPIVVKESVSVKFSLTDN